jgi:Leucine-rich repeat (LRR) protein
MYGVKLDLHSNKLGDCGSCRIAQSLELNRTLKILDLNFSQMSEIGAAQLALSIKHNTSLQELSHSLIRFKAK